jgi:ankyrin repeat protein
MSNPDAETIAAFFAACEAGDVDTVRRLLATNPALVRTESPAAPHHGWTGLHAAAGSGHDGIVRLLLEHEADPNAREAGDNTYPLHWAAARGHLSSVRALLDAGGDVQGAGDLHELDVIGWATYFRQPGDAPRDLVSLLIQRGARHHIMSAVALGDLALIRSVAASDPGALGRRMSRFEHGQTPLHLAITRRRDDVVGLLIELGADLDAVDHHGQTAFESALLSGNREAAARLRAAGAARPPLADHEMTAASLHALAGSVGKCVPMLQVTDVAESLAWYTAIGFTEVGRHADSGVVNFGMVALGKAQLMLTTRRERGEHEVSIWFYTDQIEPLYQLLRSMQLRAGNAELAGESDTYPRIEFVEYLNEPFYGGRQFGVRDPNGYLLYFTQPAAASA